MGGILEDLHKILVMSLTILEYLIRILEDPQGSWESNERSLRTFDKILGGSLRTCKILGGSLRIFARSWKDPRGSLQNICKDPQGSFIFLPRSLRIFEDPIKILKDPQGSWQENEGSLRIFAKISEDLN